MTDNKPIAVGECMECGIVADESNRISVCQTCWVTQEQLKAERDKAIEIMISIQKIAYPAATKRLELEWKDGEAKWGVFYLWVAHEPHIDKDGKWRWCVQLQSQIDEDDTSFGYMSIKDCFGRVDSELLAQQAAEKALERIINGEAEGGK